MGPRDGIKLVLPGMASWYSAVARAARRGGSTSVGAKPGPIDLGAGTEVPGTGLTVYRRLYTGGELWVGSGAGGRNGRGATRPVQWLASIGHCRSTWNGREFNVMQSGACN